MSCQVAQSVPIRTGHVVSSVLFSQLKTVRHSWTGRERKMRWWWN